MPTSSYVLPQALIFQIFNLHVAVPSRRLFAFIYGPNGYTFRYSVEEEKAQAYLGVYDHQGTNVDGEYKTCYAWPNKPLGRIDESYTKLFIDKALLRMWSDNTGSMVKKASNKIRHPSVNFATGNGYTRNAALLRDIQVNDYVRITGSDGTNTYDKWTYIRGIAGDTVAAVVDAAEANELNAPQSSASYTATRSSGSSDEIDIADVDVSAYDGLADGNVTETYVIECITGSTGGDLTTAVLRVTSASGNDDDLALSPEADGDPTVVGTRGLEITWAIDQGSDFLVGDTWTVEVTQRWDVTEATSGGTYTGTKDRIYLVEVTKGGVWADSPQITVTAVDGTDFSGPTTISLSTGTTTTTSVAGVMVTAAAPVGTEGVTIRFSDEGLCKGDRWTISATAAAEGVLRTLILAHSLDSAIPIDNAGISDLEVAIYMRKDISVPLQSLTSDGDYNWGQSQTEFCVMADIHAYDASWVDGNGDLVALPVINDPVATGSNRLYVEYRVWLSELTESVSELTDIGQISQIDGPITTDNPLKYAMSKALENNNGQPVKYMAVTNPDDLESWTDVLAHIEERTDVYGLVPLTFDPDVLDASEGHVNAQSTEVTGRWRGLWVGLENVTSKQLVTATTSSDGEVVLATTADDPNTSGQQYTLVTVTSGNADLLALDVAAGDIVRFKYVTDAWGTVTYSEFVVDDVLTEQTLRLVSGTTAAENTPIKMEIHRNLRKTEQADEVGRNARAWDNRRVKAVLLHKMVGSQPVVPSYYVAAAEAAMASGVAPQQGLTRYSVNGFDALDGQTNYFSRTQLDAMAALGTFLVTTDSQSGVMYNRHAVTTADYTDVKKREEMFTRNLDSISYYMHDLFSPYIGKTNATDELLPVLRAEVNGGVEYLRVNGATVLLGGQLISAEILDLRVSPVFLDRIVVVLSCQLPLPFNNAEVQLLV